ncbi:hypothetical protein [Thalassoglobus polymorphus]|uniref:Uncharacterized protein n=1 Tax=Thalassoglobus polymorphus TaxID=2527994 RepID=A0A517QMM1_9PLAN|nr:hypothetical protein [Thalassoglobus polymorphus]QDT32890.1 hypothetical protein Mal48_21380 [Thalassoglobus polymorphus]
MTNTPHTPDSSSPPRNKGSRGVMIATVIMGIVILLPSMVGFVNKLMEFRNVAQGDADGVFALTPLANYTLASLGFFCLLIWATAHGMFHNIEGPKYTMLDREDDLDANEPNYVPKWAGGKTKKTKSQPSELSVKDD